MEPDILTLDRIRLIVDKPTKKRTLELVAELCAPGKMQADCFQALIEREQLGSTSLGEGVALPHARLSSIDKPVACFLQLKKPIQFESPDGQPVDLIFGLLVPEADTDAHLKLLANIAAAFNRKSVREALRNTHSKEEALKILTETKGDAALAS